MKNLSLVNNVWVEKVDPNLTDEEKVALENKTNPPSEDYLALVESVKARCSKNADQADAEAAQAIYDEHKIANSQLIAVDISLPSGKGIINCRVDGEHKQIRF